MLKEVLGLLFFFACLLPSMLPSREPLRLVPCDEGSANMIDAELLVGDGGPESSASADRVRACLSPFWVVSAGFSAAVPKGFNDAMKLVGSEGTHWRAFPKGGCCCCVATAIVDCCGKGDSGGDRGVSCYVDM
jgi:hypothetical protein